MGMGLAGGILGGLTGLYSVYQQRKQMKAQNALMEKQYELSKLAYEQEAQARAEANQKEVDVDNLLETATAASTAEEAANRGITEEELLRAPTDLTGGSVQPSLWTRKSNKLGGGMGTYTDDDKRRS